MKQRLIQKNLKALVAYSLKNIEKGKLYEVYNHYLHYSDFMSASTRTTVVPVTVFLHTWNGLKFLLHRTITKSGNRSLVI